MMLVGGFLTTSPPPFTLFAFFFLNLFKLFGPFTERGVANFVRPCQIPISAQASIGESLCPIPCSGVILQLLTQGRNQHRTTHGLH